jgi:Secretin and TonB N terminus short domain.
MNLTRDRSSFCIISFDVERYLKLSFLLLCFLCIRSSAIAQDNPLQKRISLTTQTTTLYNALNAISDVIGYYFIYDSEVVNSDKMVSVSANNEMVESILKRLLGNDKLHFRIVEQHILIYKVDSKLVSSPSNHISTIQDSLLPIVISGRIIDKETKKPLPYVSVGIAKLSIGTITNTDGDFVLKVAHSAKEDTITISHIGYKQFHYPVRLIGAKKLVFGLETEFVSIQEVIIRGYDPEQVINRAIESRSINYATEPYYLTAFYREGVEKNKSYLSYSEAIFKIYKTSFSKSPDLDQVKLLKSRKLLRSDHSDTLSIKIKAGISASLNLDLMKNLPDFLSRDYMGEYRYQRSDMVTIDSRSAYAVDFKQLEKVTDPLYKGVIYIDAENLAIVGIDFEINPDYIDNITNQLVVKKSMSLKVNPEKVAYSVRYRKWGGKYYLSHLRGDIFMRVRKRNHLFANTFHTYLEMATVQLDTINVQRFARQEVVKPFVVFNDIDFSYDSQFWGDYNYIVPEESLSEALSRVAIKIESVETDK